MARKNTVKTTALPVPQSKAEAELLIADIGHAQRAVAVLQAKMNDELEQHTTSIKQRFQEDAGPLNAKIDQAFAAVHAWAEANRSTLLKGKAKTAILATGVVNWRRTPKKVTVRGVAAVLEALKKHVPNAVRNKPEIDKEYILANPAEVEHIKGISFSQQEEFFVRPNESELEKSVTQKLAEAA